MGLPSSPIKILGKSVQGFPSYDRTNKQQQTNRDTNFKYIFRTIDHLIHGLKYLRSTIYWVEKIEGLEDQSLWQRLSSLINKTLSFLDLMTHFFFKFLMSVNP